MIVQAYSSLRHTVQAACCAAVMLLAAPAVPARGDNGKFDFPTGRITYHFTAGAVAGTSVLVWDENGRRFRQDTTGVNKGPNGQQKIESFTIGDGKYLYVHQSAMGKQLMRIPMPKTPGGASPIGA